MTVATTSVVPTGPALTRQVPGAIRDGSARPEVRGKFVYAGGQKLYVRGVTYGAFAPGTTGQEFDDLEQIRADFTQMVANGINAVRIPHTMPPRHLLDEAHRQGLQVMVGLSAEQYVGYLIDRKGAPDIEAAVAARVAACAGHPALLCYGIGNEIPAPTARWIGREKLERYIERLYRTVKDTDPGSLVTYVNYPSTEYLQLDFLDLVCFNVYLEEPEKLDAYLARLQNIAGDRPLLMSELGLDSLRNGEPAQARSIDWQLRSTFAGGCAGAFVFSWTDDWFRGDSQVDDWAFGLTDSRRLPKPALAAASRAFGEVPFSANVEWPSVSVVVCAYNAESTMEECLDGCAALDYPNYEVVVVNDGSTDRTGDLARQYDVTVIDTPNQGLSEARNVGLKESTGGIVAYLDSDAWPDPHWLKYLARTFMTGDFAGVGGPNLPPAGDGLVADAVASSPGNPVHVLLTDREAEHIPGCNMAFRRDVLEKIGGFDPTFHVAGDDVDACWRIEEEGWKLGFSPAAVVWHHRRSSVRTYLKQQRGYGKAEALLERKWPDKYNLAGHLNWGGRLYGRGAVPVLGRVQRVYHGVWGRAPFQSLYDHTPASFRTMPLMPEWWLLSSGLALACVLGALWRPLLFATPLLAVSVGASLVLALAGAAAARPPCPAAGGRALRFRAVTAALHLLQPLARLWGRIDNGLSPWRGGSWHRFSWPWTRKLSIWREEWAEPDTYLLGVEAALRRARAVVRRGGVFDDWDFDVHTGRFAAARLLMAVEDHGAGTQYVRFRVRPLVGRGLVALAGLAMVLGALAAASGALPGAVVLLTLGGLLVLRTVMDAGAALGLTVDNIRGQWEP